LYLGDTRPVTSVPTPENSNPSSITNGSAPEGVVELEVSVVGGKEQRKGSSHGVIGGDGSHSQAALAATDVEGGKAMERADDDGVGEGDADEDVAPRRRIPRRWPSSADIGMVTDGR